MSDSIARTTDSPAAWQDPQDWTDFAALLVRLAEAVER